MALFRFQLALPSVVLFSLQLALPWATDYLLIYLVASVDHAVLLSLRGIHGGRRPSSCGWHIALWCFSACGYYFQHFLINSGGPQVARGALPFH